MLQKPCNDAASPSLCCPRNEAYGAEGNAGCRSGYEICGDRCLQQDPVYTPSVHGACRAGCVNVCGKMVTCPRWRLKKGLCVWSVADECYVNLANCNAPGLMSLEARTRSKTCHPRLKGLLVCKVLPRARKSSGAQADTRSTGLAADVSRNQVRHQPVRPPIPHRCGRLLRWPDTPQASRLMARTQPVGLRSVLCVALPTSPASCALTVAHPSATPSQQVRYHHLRQQSYRRSPHDCAGRIRRRVERVCRTPPGSYRPRRGWKVLQRPDCR